MKVGGNYLRNEANSKDKILEFRKRLLDRNKNFIKENQDIEFEKNYKIKNLNNEMER